VGLPADELLHLPGEPAGVEKEGGQRLLSLRTVLPAGQADRGRRTVPLFLLWAASGNGPYGTGLGSAFQMCAAYSMMVRSLENLPERPTLMIAFRAQASGSL